jgi:hypothetical protein
LFDLVCNCRKKKFKNVADQNTNVTTSIESNSSEYISESYQTITSVNTQPDPNNDPFSFDDLMDNIFLTPTPILSPSSEIDELLNLWGAGSSQQLVSNCTCFHLWNMIE